MTSELAAGAHGSVSVTDAALHQIVAQAVESVEGARLRKGRRRLTLTIDRGHVRADLELAVAYGRVLPEVAGAVQQRVADALARMCGFAVDAVDVSVEELDR